MIEVYTRPACLYSIALRRALDRHGVRYTERNIWTDREAAAYVRSVAHGDETVPTVRVGEDVLVNPTPAEVMALLAHRAPHLVPEGYEPPRPGRLARWVSKVLDR